MSYVKQKPIKSTHVGCLCCGTENEQLLSLDTELDFGFGGYTVLKNDELYYMQENDCQPKTLKDIEKVASNSPGQDWRIFLDMALRDATWQRQGKNLWVLIKEGQGFA